MTIVGGGGLIIKGVDYDKSFEKELSRVKKLDPVLYERVGKTLQGLLKNPRPFGLRFEKLKGYNNPDVYTVHVTGNYKISFEIKNDIAILRRISNHNEIDRNP